MPRVLLAPDKFKGSLAADKVTDALAAGLRGVLPSLEIVRCPIADGGDGTVAAAVAAGFEYRQVTAQGPTGEPVRSGFARKDKVAVLELADVSGLVRLPGGTLEPLTAHTYGVGELIRAALDDGCRQLVLGLGGSASTDGGAGMAAALGGRLLDAGGGELPLGGGALADLDRVDLSGLDSRLAEADVIIASDVDNPLCGEHGAAAVYGPQKGANEEQVAFLDSALRQWADAVRTATGRDVRDTEGAGAAGGAGYGALAVLGARFRPGIDVILELTGFHERIAGAQLVITGEGSLDEQTLRGKGPAGVAAEARQRDIPVVAVAGRNLLDEQTLRAHGFVGVYPLSELEPDPARSMAEAAALLERVGARIAEDRLRDS